MKKMPAKCFEIINDFSTKLKSCESFQMMAYNADNAYRDTYDWIIANLNGRPRGEARKAANSSILNMLIHRILGLAKDQSLLSRAKLGYGLPCVVNLMSDNGIIRHEDKAIDASVYIEIDVPWVNMGKRRASKGMRKIPLIGLESKHYKDLPMFDSVVQTSKQLAGAMHFAKYIGVSSIRAMNKTSLELRARWKMAPNSIFVLKDIDRDSNKWLPEIESSVDPTVLEDLFREMFNHLNSIHGRSFDIKADMGLHGSENYNTIQQITI